VLFLAFGSFLAGWIVRRRVRIPPSVVPLIDRWVLNVALPAVIVSRMSRAELGADLLVPAVSAWAVMAVCVSCVAVAARRLEWDEQTRAALLLVAVLGNTSFLGLAVVEGILGPEALEGAIAYDQLGSFLVLATWGSWVAARWGSGDAGWRPVLGRMFRFAPFLALCASPLVASIGPPQWFHDALAVPGATTAPLAMFGLGLRFTMSGEGVDRRAGATALGVKMLLAPVLLWIALSMTGDAGTLGGRVAILQAAAPPMVTAGVVAASAGLAPRLAAWTVGTGTVTSLVLIPLWGLLL
jgi:predicted permease